MSSGSASVGFIGTALVICFVRGPWEKGWVGWGGGWGIRRRDLGPKGDGNDVEEGKESEVSADLGEINVQSGRDHDRSVAEKVVDELAAEPVGGESRKPSREESSGTGQG